MGESAALKSEISEEPHSTEDETAICQHEELDKAIKDLGGVGLAAKNPSATPATHPPISASRASDISAPIWDIPVDVNIVMGTAELTVARLMELENGDVVELNRHVGEALDIAVNGQNIAKGKIVKNENDESQFAIQITELVGR